MSAKRPSKSAARTARPRAPASRGAAAARRRAGDPRRRALAILAQLHADFPDADCALHHRSALELLVATILSAQCTDERVNRVTPALFARYPTARHYAQAEPAELEERIHSTGFFRNKARNLIGMGRRLVEAYDGQVPDNMEQLLTLPGVARKTANCVLGAWFRKNAGIVVDTHVGRLAQRLQLLESARNDKDAVRIEQDLMKLVPQADWTFVSHALILHGRHVCAARRPACERCSLAPHCPSAGTFKAPA